MTVAAHPHPLSLPFREDCRSRPGCRGPLPPGVSISVLQIRSRPHSPTHELQRPGLMTWSHGPPPRHGTAGPALGKWVPLRLKDWPLSPAAAPLQSRCPRGASRGLYTDCPVTTLVPNELQSFTELVILYIPHSSQVKG